MAGFVVHSATQKDDSTVLLISSILIALCLFFIDEGSFNFYWMANAGNWISFMVYEVFIFIGQLFLSYIILKKYRGTLPTFLSILFGSIIGVLFVSEIVFGSWLGWSI